MSNGTQNDRAQRRQELLQRLFSQFVDADRADERAWYQFCRWAKGRNQLEIERELSNRNGMAFWKVTA